MAEHFADRHNHVFLGDGHERNERRTWMVIALCTFMMIAEIVGGALFGSIALIADGLHMSTHASALLLAALAYLYARRHAHDERFSFGTGKFGDLAGFTSAVVLAMIAVLIAYEAATRFIWPVPIDFNQAIPIATLGLIVNIVSALLLSGGEHHHHRGTLSGHSHNHAHSHAEMHTAETPNGPVRLEIFENGVPPRFRLLAPGMFLKAADVWVETVRPGGERQTFRFADCGGYLESLEEVPEPHAFTARVGLISAAAPTTVEFHEDEHADETARRDNNMRAAIVHVLADAAVSILVIVGLAAARLFGWAWMDPLVGLGGAFVIATWSFRLIRDTGAILLDMNPDRGMATRMRTLIERDGDRLTDLHLWRLGPGHLGAIISVATRCQRGPEYYRTLLRHFQALSHVTVQVVQQGERQTA